MNIEENIQKEPHHLQTTTIRLIRSGTHTGAFNMALDEALWQHYTQQKLAGEKPVPTLRFYGWQPSALSLGYAQRAEREVDFEACRELGIDWVRRPTGGRAILHEASELTYSLVGSVDDPQFGGGVLESYRKISGALVEGLTRLGVAAQLAGHDQRGNHDAVSAACFDAPSAYEVTWQGRKIIGSAQARQRGVLLQQGTILLGVDVSRLFAVLRSDDRSQAIRQVATRLTSVEQALGHSVAYAEAQVAFIEAFAAHFGAELLESEPNVTEIALAEQLLTAKYANPAWNLERQRPVRF